MSEVKGFDIGKTRIVNDFQKMPILDPASAEETGAFLLLAGVGTKTYQRVESEILSRRVKQAAMGRNTRKALKSLEAESMQESELELVVALTKDWEGLLLDGKLVPFSPDGVKQMYLDFPWLLNQAKTFINDIANFIES